MSKAELKQAESSILQLQSSLQTTSKNIQLSKQLIQSLHQSYNSVKSHHSVSLKSPQSLHLNISLQVQNSNYQKIQKTPNLSFLKVNGETFVKQKQFGYITKSLRVNNFETLKKVSQQKSKYKISELTNKKLQKTFSCLSDNIIQPEEQIYKVSISKYKDTIKTKQQQQQRMKHIHELINNNYKIDTNKQQNKNKYIENMFHQTNLQMQIDQIKQINTNDQIRFDVNHHNRNNLNNNYQIPIRKSILDNQQNQQVVYQRMNKQRSKSRRPIFEKKQFQSVQKQIQNYEQRFYNIKQKIKMTESLIENNLQKRRQKQQQTYQISLSPQIKKNLVKIKVPVQNKSPFKGIKKSKLLTSKHSTSLNSYKLRQKSKSKSCSPNKNKLSCQKHTLLNYFSKSDYYIRTNGIVQCNKYQKQIQKQTRQRYLSTATKIPGVDRCFTYSQIYQFYILFRKMDHPEYKWIQFLMQKVKTFGYSYQTSKNYLSV